MNTIDVLISSVNFSGLFRVQLRAKDIFGIALFYQCTVNHAYPYREHYSFADFSKYLERYRQHLIHSMMLTLAIKSSEPPLNSLLTFQIIADIIVLNDQFLYSRAASQVSGFRICTVPSNADNADREACLLHNSGRHLSEYKDSVFHCPPSINHFAHFVARRLHISYQLQKFKTISKKNLIAVSQSLVQIKRHSLLAVT